MKRTYILAIVGIVGIVTFILAVVVMLVNNKEIYTMSGSIMNVNGESFTIRDNNNLIYTIRNKEKLDILVGDNIMIEYTGLLDNTNSIQDIKVVDYKQEEEETNSNGIPKSWLDNGIFSKYYNLAYDKLQKMSLEEKIGQVILARYPDSNAIEDLKKYKLGGFLFFEKNFKDKEKSEVQNMIKNLQTNSTIPLLTAVDEEGGKVVRVSSNPKLVSEKFKSPKELYDIGGFNEIKKDTINKSKILKELGLNLNLAPVVDVTTSDTAYMYQRTLGLDTKETSEYAKTVIEASKGTGVSYTLKHFPGYGNAEDSHSNITKIDDTYTDIVNNFYPPFEAGIESGAEAILVNHNVYENIDRDNPASLSPIVHNVLRNDLKFTGVIITDNLDMSAVNSIDNATLKAILAGNDIIITTDYMRSFNAIKKAVNDNNISLNTINKMTFKVLAWKYAKGLMYENQK